MSDELINQRSGRKRVHKYTELEQKYQQAQSAWDKNENDVKAWQTMFALIQLAVFNSVNKKLEYHLDREEIEQRSLDITADIMTLIRKKRRKGVSWKIDKVSSFVHLPCMNLYKPSIQFEDKVLSEDEYLVTDDTGRTSIREHSTTCLDNGILKLNGKCENDTDFPEEKRQAIIDAIEVGISRVMNSTGCRKEEIERVILKCSQHGEKVTTYMTRKEKFLLKVLRGEPYEQTEQLELFPVKIEVKEVLK